MNDEKTRAEYEASEKRIRDGYARLMQERFEETVRELSTDTTTPMRKKAAKLLRLFAQLLETELPWSVIMPMIDRFGPLMQEARAEAQTASTETTP